MSNLDEGGQRWRLVGELTEPREDYDEQWVVVGLLSALQGIQWLAPDLERVQSAAAAVKRAIRCWTTPAPMSQPVRLRVFIPADVGDWLAPTAWGFFVLEHAADEVGGTDARADPEETRPAVHRIELYLYSDAGSAHP